jgi:transcriptional regulator with XRE-family HTH domain
MMILDKKTIGEMLAAAREEKGLSQLALSKKLGYSSPQYVSNWERGACGPPINKLSRLVKILNVHPEELLEAILEETENFLRSELKMPKRSKG